MEDKIIYCKDGKIICKEVSDATFAALSICKNGETATIVSKDDVKQLLGLTD